MGTWNTASGQLMVERNPRVWSNFTPRLPCSMKGRIRTCQETPASLEGGAGLRSWATPPGAACGGSTNKNAAGNCLVKQSPASDETALCDRTEEHGPGTGDYESRTLFRDLGRHKLYTGLARKTTIN